MDNKKTRTKKIFSWIATLSVMCVFLVKSFHYHEIVLNENLTRASGENYCFHDDCPVCQFTFSYFTDAETPNARPLATAIPIDFGIQNTRDTLRDFHYTFLLRAPPQQS